MLTHIPAQSRVSRYAAICPEERRPLALVIKSPTPARAHTIVHVGHQPEARGRRRGYCMDNVAVCQKTEHTHNRMNAHWHESDAHGSRLTTREKGSVEVIVLVRSMQLPRMRCCIIACLTAFVAAAHVTVVSIFDRKPNDALAIDARPGAYGLVGDGIADDTTALIQAINASFANTTFQGQAHRVVFLAGGGATYRITSTILLPIWTRIVGYGVSRPVILLGVNTPGFAAPRVDEVTGAAVYLPLFMAINSGPGVPPAPDGGNIAFGTGIMNVNFELRSGNAGAVAIRNRVAQGAVIRACAFNLSDAFAAIDLPGWSHQDIFITGGQTAVHMAETGAWPCMFRDSAFLGQSVAGVLWQSQSSGANGSNAPWDGLSLIRVTVAASPYGIFVNKTVSLGESQARIVVQESVFRNLSSAAVSMGNTSTPYNQLTIMNCSGVETPVVVDARDAVNRCLRAPDSSNNWSVAHACVGWMIPELDENGDAPVLGLAGGAVAGAATQSPPYSDIPTPSTNVSSWTVVSEYGVVGDGVTDVTAPLQALLDAATPGATLYFPTGVYMLSNSINISADAGVALVGLHVWDTVISLFDAVAGFGNPNDSKPMLHVAPPATDAPLRTLIMGLCFRTAVVYNCTAYAPGCNSNPGATAVLYQARLGGMVDIFFDSDNIPYNHSRNSPNTEVSLHVAGGGGVFADMWSYNSYAFGGFWATDTAVPSRVYQLSDEHHLNREVYFRNVTSWEILSLQTEDVTPGSSHSVPLTCDACTDVALVGVITYRASSSVAPDGAAVLLQNDSGITSNFTLANVHLYTFSRFPYNYSVQDVQSGHVSKEKDLVLVTVRP